MKDLKGLQEYIANLSEEDLRNAVDMLNAIHCSSKENAKEAVCSGRITEKAYRSLRMAQAMISYLEEDLTE